MHDKISETDTEQQPKRFEVNPHGAYLMRLDDDNGDHILAPFDKLGPAEKTRGGCHVCLPYFGPDTSGRPQHGFGRDLEWRIEENGGTTTAYFESDVPGWEDFQAQIDYVGGHQEFTMKLTVFNGGSEPRRVSPGFHPYFAVSDATVELDGQEVSVNEYGEAQYLEGPTHILKTSSRDLRLHSDELQTWAVWSDRLGDYFCVEPTFRGPSHAAGTEPLDGEILAPGEERSYSFTISWQCGSS